MRSQLSLFAKEAILFGLTLALGLYTAYRHSFYFGNLAQSGTIDFTSTDFIILSVTTAAVLFASRRKRAAHYLFKIFLVLVVFSGSQVVLGTFVPSPWNLAVAVFLTLLFASGKVLFHNLGIIFGIGGIGAIFGLSISVEFGLVLLAALSVYDIVAVYITKHMVALARGMIESGAVFGFLIPSEFKGFFYSRNEARAGLGESFMILGSGDIGLPLIFVSSLVSISLLSAVITSVFSLLGLFLTHILFMNQVKRRAMAALPPIATMTIIGYFISLLI